MTDSTVPAVLDALFTLAQTTPTRNVIYGEPDRGQPGDFTAIGWNTESAAVINNQTDADYGLRSSFEDYDVLNEVVAWDGGKDPRPLVVRVYAELNLIREALRTNPRLGEACMAARFTGSELFIDRTTKGALARITFSVHVQAQA